VQFDANAPVALADAVLAASGGEVIGAVPVARGLVVAHVSNPGALSAAPGVVRVEEDPTVRLDPSVPADGGSTGNLPVGAVDAQATPIPPNGDPSQAAWLASGVQWDLKSMRAPAAWAGTALGAGARVCIIDSGIDGTHQELAGKVVDSTSFVTNDSTGRDLTKGYSAPGLDSVGHGSHVAGSVAARGIVMAGVAPRASLMTAKVFAATGATSYANVVNAVAWCTDHGADVINMSLGGIAYVNNANGQLIANYVQAGMDYATSRGVVVVAAAGNDNIQFPNPVQVNLPGNLRGVVSVGATGPLSKNPLVKPVPNWDPTDTAQTWRTVDFKAYYSSFGSAVTVFAPGGNQGYNLAWPFRIYNGLVQGNVLDGIFSVCAAQSQEFTPYVNNNGVPTRQGQTLCAGTQNTYTAIQGTSMATPHAAGLMALVTAEIGGARTAARGQRVISCVTKSTDNIGPSSTYGGGRTNALSAIQLLRSGGC
jgi:subtilisin family serine protease